MSNLISRQAAIYALRDAENHAFNSFYKGLEKAHKIIADLPSVKLATDLQFLQPESEYVFYDSDHGFCINTQDVLDCLRKELRNG